MRVHADSDGARSRPIEESGIVGVVEVLEVPTMVKGALRAGERCGRPALLPSW